MAASHQEHPGLLVQHRHRQPDRAAALNEAYGCCAPGGRLALVDFRHTRDYENVVAARDVDGPWTGATLAQWQRYGFLKRRLPVSQEDGVIPEKVHPQVHERLVRVGVSTMAEYSSLTAVAGAVAPQERLGPEMVRGWALQAEVDAGEWAGTSSGELAEIKALKGPGCDAWKRTTRSSGRLGSRGTRDHRRGLADDPTRVLAPR